MTLLSNCIMYFTLFIANILTNEVPIYSDVKNKLHLRHFEMVDIYVFLYYERSVLSSKLLLYFKYIRLYYTTS